MPDGSPVHDLNMWPFMRLLNAEARRDWYDVKLPESGDGESSSDYDHGRWTFRPLPIYDEDLELILPDQYREKLEGSLVKTRMTAVRKYNPDTNRECFLFDVQELTVMKMHMG